MNRVITTIESVLFASRWLMVPVYIAMMVLLAMLVFFFLADIAHALPQLPQMTDKDLIILTLSLIDLSLVANLVVLVILSGYENFVSHVHIAEDDNRPEWLTKINFTGLKLKLVASLTVIAAVHVLSSFLETGLEDNRTIGWQLAILVIFALLGLIFAITDRVSGNSH